MANNFRASCILLALAVSTPLLANAVRAEEFVSDQYGFRFRIPDGFHERTDDTPMTLRMFAEDEEQVDGYLITIHFQHLGQVVDPSQRLDPAELPHNDGLTLSLETRPWRELELQVIRQDATIAPDMQFIGYLVQIPLKDEAVQIRVQGPKSREEEILRVFNESVRGFVNTKTYVVKSEAVRPGKATHAIMQFIGAIVAPCITVAIIILFLILARHSKSKSTPAPTSGALHTLPDGPTHGQRPVGIAILAGLNLVNGAWIGGHRLLTLADVYLGPGGSATFSGSYKVAAFGDFFFAFVAVVSGIGLFVGAKWGWWLGGFHWSSRICREVLIPISATLLADQSVSSMSDDRFYFSKVSGALAIQSLILLYMFQRSVLEYFGLGSLRKVWALIKIVGAALLFSIIAHTLKIAV
jgi:hypothetical protein